jgi:Helix-turn-helix domain
VDRLLTADELAEPWQVPTGWIYAKCRTGELPKVPLPGRYIRFRLDVVERFERGELDDNIASSAT